LNVFDALGELTLFPDDWGSWEESTHSEVPLDLDVDQVVVVEKLSVNIDGVLVVLLPPFSGDLKRHLVGSVDVVEKLKENKDGINDILDNLRGVDVNDYINQAKRIEWKELLNGAEEIMGFIKSSDGKPMSIPTPSIGMPKLPTLPSPEPIEPSIEDMLLAMDEEEEGSDWFEEEDDEEWFDKAPAKKEPSLKMKRSKPAKKEPNLKMKR
jgi:hypothetical protein